MKITDWDDAYANRDHIAGADGFIERWPQEAAAFRDRLKAEGRARLDLSYGDGARQAYDLFLPAGATQGLLVFVHGGYWRAFDKSLWSQFAAGALERGWAVAMPGYTLAPAVAIRDIVAEVTRAVTAAAAEVPGPIRLSGHSAGGHLVTRLICADSALPAEVRERIAHVLSISGVHDLRPLLKTAMNADLRLDAAAAAADSPVLLEPAEGARVTAWVGAAERPEFVRQTTLLANIWTGLGADMSQVIEPRRHHFDVIDGLLSPRSDLVDTLLG